MLGHISEGSIAGCDISFNNFLEIFVIFITDSQSRTNVGSDRLVMLNNVNVDNVCLIEFPSKSEMICASGARSEIEFTIIFLFEVLYSLSRRNVLEPLMLDLSLLNLGLFQLLSLLLLLQEVEVLFVVIVDFAIQLGFQLFDVVWIMVLEVLLFAFEVDPEVFVQLFVEFQLLNSACDNASLIDIDLVRSEKVGIILVNIGFNTVF